MTFKVTLRKVCIRVYILEIQSVMLVFSTQLTTLISRSPILPPPPCVKVQYIQYIQAVYGWVEGVELCWRPYSAGV
jgi:hypothetical protein